jgi:hypothetical protein
MIFSTATVPVNPSGQGKLTREQVWAGLVLKAKDARLFLPPGACIKCEVVPEGTDFIVREAVIMNDELTEIITFAPNQKVSFHQLKSRREGVIVNEIVEDGGRGTAVEVLLLSRIGGRHAGQRTGAAGTSPDGQ